ncbi:MAG: alpha/beta hydrolase [Pseudomonadota bacterium]
MQFKGFDQMLPSEVISVKVNHQDDVFSVYVWSPEKPIKLHPFLLIHDMGEDMAAWIYTIKTLVNDGYTVYGFDLRGQGLSKEFSTAVPFKQYWLEVVQIVSSICERHEGRTPFIMAQGLGALIALSLNRYNHRFCFALVLASPLFNLSDQLSHSQILGIKFYARFMPNTNLPKWLSPRFTRNRKIKTGEEVIKIQPRVTGYMALELFEAITRSHKMLQRSFNPVLFICPEVSPVHRYDFIQRATVKGQEEQKVSYVSIQTKYHSIVSDRAEVLDTIRGYILPWAHRIEKGLPWSIEEKNK